jgi:hypothetical protein
MELEELLSILLLCHSLHITCHSFNKKQKCHALLHSTLFVFTLNTTQLSFESYAEGVGISFEQSAGS